MLNEVGQTEKDKYWTLSLIYMESKKQMSEYYKTETHLEKKLMVTSGEREGKRDKRGLGD